MSDIILKALEKVSTTYEPTGTQLRDMSNASDPQAVVDGLAGTVLEIRTQIAEALSPWGVLLEDIEPDVVLPLIYFKVVGSISKGVGMQLANKLDSSVFADLIAVGERRKNPLTAIYLRVFNRMPDVPGLVWWGDILANNAEWSSAMIEARMTEERDKLGAT